MVLAIILLNHLLIIIILISRTGPETWKWVDGVFVKFLLIVFVIRLLILLRNLCRLILGVIALTSIRSDHLSMTLGVAAVLRLRSSIAAVRFSSSLYHGGSSRLKREPRALHLRLIVVMQ